MTWGVDIHPRYQAGINIEQIRAEGFDFMAVKVSEATNSSFLAAGSADFLRRGRAVGLLCLGYHYLRAGNEDDQAQVFTQALRVTGVAGMLDAEDGAGDIRNIRAFLDACRRHGAHVPLMYLPRWYWDRIGRPDLRGLPPLWASRYVAGDGLASVMYARHNPAGWDPYGGLGVEVLQFTDCAQVAGRQIDANHYRGTRAEFAALIGTQPPEDDMPTPAEIWDHLLNDPYVGPDGPRDRKPAHVLLSYGAANAAYAVEQAGAARTELAELKAALPQLVADQVRTTLAQGVVDINITVRDQAGLGADPTPPQK